MKPPSLEIASLRHLRIDLIKWCIQTKINLKIVTRWFLPLKFVFLSHYFSGTVSHSFYFKLAVLFIFIIWIFILSLKIIAKDILYVLVTCNKSWKLILFAVWSIHPMTTFFHKTNSCTTLLDLSFLQLMSGISVGVRRCKIRYTSIRNCWFRTILTIVGYTWLLNYR